MPARLRAILEHPAAHAGLIVLAVAAAYANTHDVPFVFDDVSSISSRAAVADLASFLAAFDWRSNRALADLTFALDRQLHGLDVAGFHLVNGLVHAGAGLLVWRLALLLLASPFVAGAAAAAGPGALPPSARWGALGAGLLFVLHPVQTQAVTYLVQRYTSLATLLYLAALVLWLEARRALAAAAARGWPLWAAALLATLLAMRTKEIAFTLPLALLLAEGLFGAGGLRRRALALLPFLASLAIIPASLMAQVGSLGLATGNDRMAAEVSGVAALTRAEYLATQLRVVVTYLRLVLLPTGLNLDHDFPAQRSILAPAVVLSAAFLAAVLAAGVLLLLAARRGDRRLRLAGYGVVWFFLALSVESSLVPLDDVIFEHRLYLPMAGVALAAAAGLAMGWDALAGRPAWARRLAAAAVVAWLAALGVATGLRNETWRDPITLWRDAVAKSPGKARPHQNLGTAYADRGWREAAVAELAEVVRINPSDALGWFNLGNQYAQLGQEGPAIQAWQAMLRLQPDAPATRTQLAMSYYRLGLHAQAIAELRTVLARRPGYAPALRNLAIVQAAAQRGR